MDMLSPMMVAAFGLRCVLADLEIPDGALHAGQELEFMRAVHVGDALTYSARIGQNSVRGDWRFMAIDLIAHDLGERIVMSGKTTIMMPNDA